MKIRRVVPERTESFEIVAFKPQFFSYGSLKKVRDISKQKTQSGCFWCRKPFSKTSQLTLVFIKGKTNKLFCEKCTDNVLTEKQAEI